MITGQGDYYTTRCLLDYTCFKENYKLIAVDISNQQKLEADTKPMQQINFTGSLEQSKNTQRFFIIVEEKETVLYFPKWTVKVWFYFVLK